MSKRHLKLFYILLIGIGASLVLYEQSITTNQNVYILASGFVLLMLGLYNTTQLWIKDNKDSDTNDDTVFSEDREDRMN